MDNLFSDDDLKDVIAELNTINEDEPVVEDEEMTASQRRYEEIIKKHKS